MIKSMMYKVVDKAKNRAHNQTNNQAEDIRWEVLANTSLLLFINNNKIRRAILNIIDNNSTRK